MFYKHILTFIVTLFASLAMFSQSFTLSPYSKFGIGDLSFTNYVPGYSMGFTSIALRSNRYINPNNPAAATEIDTLSFIKDISLTGRIFTLKNSSSTFTNTNTDIHYIAMGFSISKLWKTYIGLSPISNTGYKIQESKNIDTLLLINTYKGDGGLNELFWSNGWNIIQFNKTSKTDNILKNHKHKVALGLKSSYVFGSIDKYTSAVFPEDKYIFDLNKTERLITNGTDFKAGFQYQYLLQEEKEYDRKNILKIIAGFTYRHLNPINAKQTLLVTKFLNLEGKVTKDTIQNIVNKKGKIEFPQSVGFGLTIETNDKFTWTGEISLYQWSKVKFFDSPSNLKNSMFLATGIQYIPDPTKFYQYWKMTHYRIGAYYHHSYLNINYQNIDEFGITFGLGLPITKTDKGDVTMIRRKLPPTINLSLAYGTRGTTQNNLIKESFWQFSVSLNIHDIWFVKRKFN